MEIMAEFDNIICSARPRALTRSDSDTSCVVGTEDSMDVGLHGKSGVGEQSDFMEEFKGLFIHYSDTVTEASMGGENSYRGIIQSGGLQQYFLRKVKSKVYSPSTNSSSETNLEAEQMESSIINLMPDSILVQIFSYLDHRTLCRISQVCSHWDTLSHDKLIWSRKLEADMSTWQEIGHSSNPHVLLENPNWSHKQIYLRCSPDVNKSMKNETLSVISTLLKFVLHRKVPKVVMFGPGMESNTSRIVRDIINDTTGTFSRVGMFPGRYGGIGGGLSLKLEQQHKFDFITLYTTTRAERENLSQEERMGMRRNRLMVQQGSDRFQLLDSVKQLCHSVDGFVFLIEVSEDNSNVAAGKRELDLVLAENPHIPLTVLACIPNERTQRTSCVDIVRELELSALDRPWKVYNCVADTRKGIVAGLRWLVECAQSR